MITWLGNFKPKKNVHILHSVSAAAAAVAAAAAICYAQCQEWWFLSLLWIIFWEFFFHHWCYYEYFYVANALILNCSKAVISRNSFHVLQNQTLNHINKFKLKTLDCSQPVPPLSIGIAMSIADIRYIKHKLLEDQI